MTQSEILFVAVALLFNAGILYVVIATAVNPKRRDTYLHNQVNILIKIAQKAGVSDEELNKILHTGS